MDKMSLSRDEMPAEWEIRRYTPDMEGVWNEFVATRARNATFLFDRRYMDYHSDRFADCSMMAYRRGRLAALLPANLTPDGTLHSHQGLTYGGWIIPDAHFDATDMLRMWPVWLEECRDRGISEIDYKPLPWIFARRPAQEDRYMLFRSGARLTECNLSSAVDLACLRGFNTLQRRHVRKAAGAGCVTGYTDDCGPFREMLAECLMERHGAVPVHSEAELRMLMDRFPENIRIAEARLDGELVAGVCLYITDTVTHTQYIASTPRGREVNALSLLFERLIADASARGSRYFDFGTSNEDHGRYLNEGLLRQKASFGASGVTFDRWTITLGAPGDER